jgi:hypothetical protein
MSTTAAVGPQPTPLPHLPQEIINLIIDKLYDILDPATVNEYWKVSRWFLAQTRKRIFHHVQFTSIAEIVRLHDLLILAPDIVRYIRKLNIVVYTTGFEDPAIELTGGGADKDRMKEWLASDTETLTNIFEMLSAMLSESSRFLERLEWSNIGPWDDLSSRLKSASAKLFKFSGLIYLSNFRNLPLGSILHLSPVKQLTLFHVRLQDNNSTPINLPQLEALRLIGCHRPEVQLHCPMLRRLSVEGDDGETCALAPLAIWYIDNIT